jgi:hypothetical protein
VQRQVSSPAWADTRGIMNSIYKATASHLAVFAGSTLILVSCSDVSPDPSVRAKAAATDALNASDHGPSNDRNTPDNAAGPASSDAKPKDCDVNDFLYVGDAVSRTVVRFNANTGASSVFVPSIDVPLDTPRGLVFDPRKGPNGDLLLVDQNTAASVADLTGEVLRYRRSDGIFLGALVAPTEWDVVPTPIQPLAPRGMVVEGHIVYVADQGDSDTDNDGVDDDPALFPGRVTRWHVQTGAFLGDLSISGFPANNFHARGIAFGPDGNIYVSSIPTTTIVPAGGHILRFNPKTGAFLNVVVDGSSYDCNFSRPEGLTFGPDGRLYIATFRAVPTDTAFIDKIVIVEISKGKGTCVDEIELDAVGDVDRVFAQALIFGPKKRLFVPIAGNGPDTGAIRRYDVKTKQFDTFVQPLADGGPLEQPWYLTFGKTNPATLAYEP